MMDLLLEKVSFKIALGAIKSSPLKVVKLPEWDGYWKWDNDKKTIIIHCADGKELDIRESDDMYYTLTNVCRDDWMVYRIEQK